MSVDEEIEEGRRRKSFSGLLITLLILLLILGGLLLFARWQSRGLDYTLHFEDAKGLRAGDPVMLSGVQIGEVKGVELAGERDVRVKVRVDDEHAEKVLAGSTAVISNPAFPNVSGQKVVEIHNPAVAEEGALPEGAEITGREGLVDLKAWQIEQRLQNLGGELSEQSRSMAEKISVMAEEMKDIPESPEVREAIDKLDQMSRDLSERGRDTWDRLSDQWEDLSRDLSPILENWSRTGRDRARETLDRTRQSLEEASERARQRLEERKSQALTQTPAE